MENHTDWQHPFVDVFKRYNTYEAPKSYKGSVNIIHDPIIARKAFKISGSILSNNTVTIPDPSTSDVTKACNLTGRYIYVELLASPEKYFCIHFQIAIKDREPGVRFTLTNMEKDYTVSGGNTLKIPFNNGESGLTRNLWTIACIDIQHHLQNFGLFSKGVIKNYSGVHTIKSIQVCSNLNIRGIYTSCNIYDWESLPKEMSFKMVKGGRWEDNYNFVYLPSSINPEEVKRKLKSEGMAQQKSGQKEFPINIVEREEASTTRKKKIDTISKQSLHNNQQEHQMSGNIQQTSSYGPLPSEPFLELSNAFSFSSLYNPDLLFREDKIYYSAGGILVCKDINTGEQEFLQGHTDYIVAMDMNENWLVTVQEGQKSSVRIWIDHKCICSFQCPYEKVQQIRLSHKKHLAMVGLDPYKRQAILVFDISKVQTTRTPILIAKQLSDFNILTIKFSPVDTQKLVSCGKQNIRFWRVKNQHLPGSPVVLNHHARNTVFTVFDFEYEFDNPNPLKQTTEIRHVFVGSQTGLLFQINYNTHELEEVYKLHDNAAISSVVVSAGFCITGSEDQMLRIWPMSFEEFTLEASNDGVVTNLALNEDASKVACGTSIGTLNVLDLTTNDCRTIVRAHTEEVIQIVYHEFSNSMITLSNDQTIRVWDATKLQQTYEFPYPTNDPCMCISGNPNSMHFAAGFQSGVLRIIDIENVSVCEEIKHHENPILHIEYSPDGRFLSVLQQKLNMLYSPLHSHQPIKQLPVEIPSKYKSSTFSPDSELIAVIGDSGTHINIWGLKTLQMVGKIFTHKVIRKLKFATSETIWALFEDTSIRRYNLEKMTVEVEMQAMHRQSLNDIAFDTEDNGSHLLFTVGADSFVKVWDYSFLREPHQVFIGHSKKINGVIFKNNILWTIGSEGVLVWNFNNESGERFEAPPIFAKEKKATFINNNGSMNGTFGEDVSSSNPLLRNVQQSRTINHNAVEESNLQNMEPIEQSQSLPPKKIMFSSVMKKNGETESSSKFVPKKIEMNFQAKSSNYRKNKKREGRPKLTCTLSETNVENGLPWRHFFQESLLDTQLEYPKKIEQIKENGSKFKLEYLVGIEQNIHEHIVWNFMYGWYAYIYDNLIIVESLNKNRSQRIITLPEKLSTLALSKDFKKLLCSSAFNPNKKERLDMSASESASQISGDSIVEGDDQNTANIYVLGLDFTIEKKFEFHPKGVQSMRLTTNSKYLVSIGNFRECTVCVWDYQMGKLKASNCTLDKLNDIAVMEQPKDGRLLEFATVGRDQIHFWAFTKEEKLEYYDVFIKSDEDEDDYRQNEEESDMHSKEIVELTSCDYLNYEEQPYLLCGTSKGELVIVRYGDFKVIWRKSVCSAEIVNIKCTQNRTILGSADGNLYFWNHNTNILQSEPNPSFVRMNLYYSVNGLHFDDEGNEGVVSTAEAVYYVNLTDQFHSLLAGSSPSEVLMTKSLNNGQFLLSSHKTGRLKLWNVDTAEELKTYKWKYPCTEAYYDDAIHKVVCFCENQSVKLVNIKKFTKQENYLPQELGKVDNKTDDYVVYSAQVMFGGRPSRWIFFKKGSVYSFEIVQEGKRKTIRTNKVLQLGYTVQEVFINADKNLLLVSSVLGVVSAYNVDLHQSDNKYSLLMVDQALFEEFCYEKKGTLSIGDNDCSCEDEHRIRLAPSKVLNETYLVIGDESQYVYFRNYMKRVTFQKISLPSLPRSILLQESRKDSTVHVGLKEGGIVSVNAIHPEDRVKYEGIVNNSIDHLYYLKSKSWLVVGHPNAMAFYSTD